MICITIIDKRGLSTEWWGFGVKCKISIVKHVRDALKAAV